MCLQKCGGADDWMVLQSMSEYYKASLDDEIKRNQNQRRSFARPLD